LKWKKKAIGRGGHIKLAGFIANGVIREGDVAGATADEMMLN
jgi:hypothetical protein